MDDMKDDREKPISNNNYSQLLDRGYSFGFLTSSLKISNNPAEKADFISCYSFKTSLNRIEYFGITRSLILSTSSQIKALYQQNGKGVMAGFNHNFLRDELQDSKINSYLSNAKNPLTLTYWDKGEIENLESGHALLGKNSPHFLKQVLLDSIDNYNPESEVLVLLCFFSLKGEDSTDSQTITQGHFLTKIAI